jgi:hypothetical protein
VNPQAACVGLAPHLPGHAIAAGRAGWNAGILSRFIEARDCAMNDLAPESSPRQWLGWSSLLIAAYLVVGYLGWRRTLIETEVWALYHAGQPLSEQLQSIRGDLVHPPLMYMLERIWLGTFGQTDSAAKALALVINPPTLVLFTWLASRVTAHWQMASALFAARYLIVGSAPNEVRMYGLALLFTVTAMILWDMWREKPTNGKLAGWTLLMTLLVYTHLFGALIVFAFVVANWLYGPRRWTFTFASMVSGLAFLPWFFYVLPVYLSRGLRPNLTWAEKNPFIGFARVPYILMGSAAPSPSAAKILMIAAVLVDVALIVLVWRGLGSVWPPHRQSQHAAQWFWVALILTAIPILFLFLFSVLATPAFNPRFILGAFPGYCLFVILLADLDWRRSRLVLYGVFMPWVVAMIALTVVQAPIRSVAYRAAAVIAGDHRPGDVILCKGSCNPLYWEWTRRQGGTGRIEAIVGPFDPEMVSMDVLPQVPVEKVDLRGANRVWLVFAPGGNPQAETAFLQLHGYALEKEYPAGRPYLRLMAQSPSPSPSP